MKSLQPLDQISIQYLKGVGPARKKIFEKLGVATVEDLLYFFPRRYEDRRNPTPIAQLKVGEYQTVVGKVLLGESRRSWYSRKRVTEVLLDDKSGRLTCVWFNQPYIQKYFQEGRRAVCFGKVAEYKNRLQMVSPEYEILDENNDDPLALDRISPVYPLTRGMTQRYLRKTVRACLDKYEQSVSDELPVALRNKYRLYNIKRSLEYAHFPLNFEDQEQSLKRISFEEFFFFQISIILRRLSITRKEGIAHKITDKQTQDFMKVFPFTLTTAQQRAIGEIRRDMEKDSPMLRLLQGDVGSGKTIVAFYGCLMAIESGCQSCLMAPTEILARQHYENIQQLLELKSFKKVKPALLMSNLKASEKKDIYQKIENGKVNFIVGTHALLMEEVKFKKLSFAVIDEQHKFGVRQRALLTEKGTNPDVLIMTATPIPRTLCITLYGDLDLSIIDEVPPGRGAIKTLHYPEEKSAEVYALVKEKVKEGQQIYIVYPIIEESEALDLKAAEEMYKQLKKKEFKSLRVGLIHGQMKKSEGATIMAAFKNKKLDVLIATTVIEVGVDVPNASVMVIEHADRFGLSQLHQLRGRIGRGPKDSLCILVSDSETDDGAKRLEAILSTNDGFKIAQRDLEIRGPGRFFGRHQHGLNELKVANPATQLDILELARKEATALIETDFQLTDPGNQRILEVIRKRYPTYLQMVTAG